MHRISLLLLLPILLCAPAFACSGDGVDVQDDPTELLDERPGIVHAGQVVTMGNPGAPDDLPCCPRRGLENSRPFATFDQLVAAGVNRDTTDPAFAAVPIYRTTLKPWSDDRKAVRLINGNLTDQVLFDPRPAGDLPTPD